MHKDQNSLPLAGTLDRFLAGEPAYFCIPGHRFERGISPELRSRFGDSVFKYDLTEANGLDDLHHAQGAIKEAQELAADLFGVKHSRFLVNGTTCGNEALIMAVAGEGDKIILARNSHKSVTAGLILSGAEPVWVMPENEPDWGFYTVPAAETVERIILENPDAKAVFVVSPTYYGQVGKIGELAETCHKYNLPLFVDEAHGSHLYFSDHFPKGALENGADAVVMSTHKTLGSMTQTSMLHINSDRISIERIDQILKLVMSSSPSYVFMTSLDAARHQMAVEGEKIMQRAFESAIKLRTGIERIPGFRVYNGADEEEIRKADDDPLRVVFSAVDLGISGYGLSDMLFDEYGCAFEMADGRNVVAVVTAGNTNEEIERVVSALGKISQKYSFQENAGHKAENHWFTSVPEMRLTPRKAFYTRTEEVKLEDSVGRICAQTISPYPPGIPVLVPGEVMDEKIYEFLKYCIEKHINIHSDGSQNLNSVKVVAE